MFEKFRQFLADESGATAIEYSLIASGIALAIIATVYGIGPKLNTTFSSGDCLKIGGQAAIAIGGDESLAGWNFRL